MSQPSNQSSSKHAEQSEKSPKHPSDATTSDVAIKHSDDINDIHDDRDMSHSEVDSADQEKKRPRYQVIRKIPARFKSKFIKVVQSQKDIQNNTSGNTSATTLKETVYYLRANKQALKESFLGTWDILILVLSVYTLFALAVQVSFPLSKPYHDLFAILDDFICFIFLIDFTVRLMTAPSKKEYLKWGWIDLISSIPTLDSFRWGRVLRLARIIRVLRSAHLIRTKLAYKLQDSFVLVLLAAFLLSLLSAMGILYLEANIPKANIKTGQDALWWAWVTMTTVGYGDFYPVSSEGRILATVLMSAGVGIFSIFTVKCTQYLVKEDESEDQKLLYQMQQQLRVQNQVILQLQEQIKEMHTHMMMHQDAHDPTQDAHDPTQDSLSPPPALAESSSTEPSSTEPSSANHVSIDDTSSESIT